MAKGLAEIQRSKDDHRASQWQDACRELEGRIRLRALAVVSWRMMTKGISLPKAAREIGMKPSTVRDWKRRWEDGEDRLQSKTLGKPVEGMERHEKDAVLALLMLVGPGIGLPSLAAIFHWVPQAALERLLGRYRKVWRWKNRYLILALRWCCVGAVWAMDYTQPDDPIEGRYTYLLMVRDLASGRQLMSLPVEFQSMEDVVAKLTYLVECHGAPLVLKSDNGSPFKNDLVEAFCRARGITPLLSPPGTPEYNGAVESGIGSLETCIHHAAARNGRPGDWTCDDVEEARRRVNELGRPRGRDGPTPDEAWVAREPITDDRRQAFLAMIAETEIAVRAEYALHPERPQPAVGPLLRPVQESLNRLSVSRALVALGYLEFRRRRISPPVILRRLLKISG